MTRIFDTIQEILRSLSLSSSLFKGRIAPIRRSGNRGVKLQADIIGGFEGNLIQQMKPQYLEYPKTFSKWLQFILENVPLFLIANSNTSLQTE